MDADLALALRLSQEETRQIYTTSSTHEPVVARPTDSAAATDALIARLMQDEMNQFTFHQSAVPTASTARGLDDDAATTFAMAQEFQAQEDARMAREMQDEDQRRVAHHHAGFQSFESGFEQGDFQRRHDQFRFAQAKPRRARPSFYSPRSGMHRGLVEMSPRTQTAVKFASYGAQPSWEGGGRGTNPEVERALATDDYEALLQLDEQNVKVGAKNLHQTTAVERLSTEQVEGLKRREEGECVICMGDFAQGDRCRRLPCLHMFHVDCVDKWLKENHTCPVCQRSVNDD